MRLATRTAILLMMMLTATATAVVAAAYRDTAGAASAAKSSQRRGPHTAVVSTAREPLRSTPTEPSRRWPAEIEQLLSSMPRIENGQVPPTIETDQRCSRVEDGLAHCVMLECQTAGEQTACFEMVVTARRLSGPPSRLGGGPDDDPEPQDDEGPGAYEDHPLDGPLTAPSLLDTRYSGRHPGEPRPERDRRQARARTTGF